MESFSRCELPACRPTAERERAMRIDCHAHVHPPAYRAALGDAPLPPMALADLEASMERHEIDAAVISTGPPGAFAGPGADPSDLARRANDGIAEIVHDQRAKFAGVGTLPLPDLPAALSELDRVYDELALDGVMLLSNLAGTYLGDPVWEPLFAALAQRDAYVFLHPGLPPHPLPLSHPVWLYEFTFETTRAVANLIYSGTLERYPSIRFQLSHLGGAAPFLAHRIASLADREPERAGLAPAGALAYLQRLYYDTGLSNHAPGVVATREITALEHIVFGTDWPYAALPTGRGDPAPGLDAALTRAERTAVDCTNATALVPRLSTAPSPPS
jgi:6-methylsalicylate decarboxylase